jgi:uncharacterized membrane protein
MHPKVFLGELEDRKVTAAIAAAEQKSSGEIRVYVSAREVEDVVSEAQVQFLRLGMERTRERNGVLIFIAPRSRKFAVVGDTAIHEKCGDEFWREVAGAMQAHLREQRYTDGLLAAIDKVGSALAAHFPHRPDDKNELPDEIAGDEGEGP